MKRRMSATTTSTAPEPTSNGLMVILGAVGGHKRSGRPVQRSASGATGGREESQRGRRQPGCNREGAEGDCGSDTHRFPACSRSRVGCPMTRERRRSGRRTGGYAICAGG